MDQLTLYNQILGLKKPWSAVSVDLDERQEQVLVTVSYDDSLQPSCPKCGKSSRIYDFRKRRWRHLDTCQFQTVIEADVPRVTCPEHGVVTLQVPWAEGSSHYSRMFELMVLEQAKTISLSTLSRRLRLAWSCIDRIVQRGIARGLTRRWRVDCRYLFVDETCIQKGRDYITVLSNHQGHVLAIADGKTSDSLMACFKAIPIQYLHKARSISMDMSPSYLHATHAFFGRKARQLIAIDHFHITKVLTAAVSDIRKAEMATLPGLNRIHFYKTRYHWLRNGNHLSEDVSAELEQQKALLHKTAIAWMLKEKARDIWHGREPPNRKSWETWFKLVEESGLKGLQLAATTLRKHLRGILNAMRLGVSNARAEALNKNIKNVARQAHGFRNRERYKASIWLRYGGLDMGFTH